MNQHNVPPLARYAQTTMADDPILYAEAPWMHGKHVTLATLCLPYVYANRLLPVGVLERA